MIFHTLLFSFIFFLCKSIPCDASANSGVNTHKDPWDDMPFYGADRKDILCEVSRDEPDDGFYQGAYGVNQTGSLDLALIHQMTEQMQAEKALDTEESETPLSHQGPHVLSSDLTQGVLEFLQNVLLPLYVHDLHPKKMQSSTDPYEITKSSFYHKIFPVAITLETNMISLSSIGIFVKRNFSMVVPYGIERPTYDTPDDFFTSFRQRWSALITARTNRHHAAQDMLHTLQKVYEHACKKKDHITLNKLLPQLSYACEESRKACEELTRAQHVDSILEKIKEERERYYSFSSNEKNTTVEDDTLYPPFIALLKAALFAQDKELFENVALIFAGQAYQQKRFQEEEMPSLYFSPHEYVSKKHVAFLQAYHRYIAPYTRFAIIPFQKEHFPGLKAWTYYIPIFDEDTPESIQTLQQCFKENRQPEEKFLDRRVLYARLEYCLIDTEDYILSFCIGCLGCIGGIYDKIAYHIFPACKDMIFEARFSGKRTTPEGIDGPVVSEQCGESL